MKKKNVSAKSKYCNDLVSVVLVQSTFKRLTKKYLNLYRNISKKTARDLIKLCSNNGWNVIEYIRFYICTSRFKNGVNTKGLLGKQYQERWKQALENGSYSAFANNRKESKNNSLDNKDYMKKLLEEIHGQTDWIEEVVEGE